MAVITSIKPQKNKKRVNIYLDGKFGFGVDLENFVKLGLKVGQELSERDIERIVKKAEFVKTYEKLLKFATLRPRSKKEVEQWFFKHKIHESLQQELEAKLIKLDLLDDEKFAKWWVDQRKQFKSKSIREVEYELRNKGIERNIIKSVVDSSGLDEVKSAKELLAKNYYKWKKYDSLIKRKKMNEFLARKGFSWSTIKEVLSDVSFD